MLIVRQKEDHASAAGDPVFSPDAAAMRLDNAPGNRQSQPRAAGCPAARLLAAIELLEHVRQIGRGKARPVVLDGNHHAFALPAGANRHGPTGQRVMERIFDQIFHDAPDLFGAHQHRIDVLVNLSGKGDAP